MKSISVGFLLLSSILITSCSSNKHEAIKGDESPRIQELTVLEQKLQRDADLNWVDHRDTYNYIIKKISSVSVKKLPQQNLEVKLKQYSSLADCTFIVKADEINKKFVNGQGGRFSSGKECFEIQAKVTAYDSKHLIEFENIYSSNIKVSAISAPKKNVFRISANSSLYVASEAALADQIDGKLISEEYISTKIILPSQSNETLETFHDLKILSELLDPTTKISLGDQNIATDLYFFNKKVLPAFTRITKISTFTKTDSNGVKAPMAKVKAMAPYAIYEGEEVSGIPVPMQIEVVINKFN